jgi:hypothetical protein
MAAPTARFRQWLSAPGLIKTLHASFSKVADSRRKASVTYSMGDALSAAFAMFSLKYPSMLQFDTEAHADPRLIHNLKSLYALKSVPSDTQMREILDAVPPQALRPAFEALHSQLQRGKALEPFAVFQGRYLLAVDGTGQFSSNRISCPHCCVKERKNAATEYYHQCLAAVMVHPDIKGIALPVALEPITRHDGQNKNDCERVAAKRLLSYIASAFPQRQFIVIEDALASNGPHLSLLKELEMDFIVGVKPAGNGSLFGEVAQRQQQQLLIEWESPVSADGAEYGYRYTNDIALNKSHPDLKVNYLEWWEIDKKGRQKIFSWVTSLSLEADNVEQIARMARARWRVENECFNTLKNQGYEFEHNYGHGKQYLSSTLAALMMLAFLVDQIQEHCCRVFEQARQRNSTKKALWMRMAAMMYTWRIADWSMMMDLLIDPDRVLIPPDSG